MGLFKKKINEEKATDYFFWAYDKILSKEEMHLNKNKLAKLIEAYPVFKDVEQVTFNLQLSAVNLELLDIAWTKYLFPKGVDMLEMITFNSKVQEKLKVKYPSITKLEDLMHEYNQCFAKIHPSIGGFTFMADRFIVHILGDNLDDVSADNQEDINNAVREIHAQFNDTYAVSRASIKQHKLVS
jgi:hypothetical protein